MTGVMIFAAGFGTRMRPLTNHMPKPLIPVMGKPLLDYAFDLALDAKLDPIIINAHYKADQIVTHMAGKPAKVLVENSILDTGGGLKAASNFFPNPTAYTMNSDVIWSGPNPFQILKQHWRDDMDALLLCAPANQTIGHISTGDFNQSPNGTLIRGENNSLTYLGAQIIKLGTLQNIDKPVFSLNAIWNQLIEKKTLFGCLYPGKWCDVGQPKNITPAENLLRDSGNV